MTVIREMLALDWALLVGSVQYGDRSRRPIPATARQNDSRSVRLDC